MSSKDSLNPPTPAPAPTASAQPSKAYQPAAVEPGIIAKWDASGAFHADPARVLSGEKKPYCILIPPPNVTGALHLGHALNNTLQDVLTRAHRMMGYETLWMPGTDHAGIATQAVVERRLKKEQNKTRKDFSREEFIALVQQWKDEYEARITGQLKRMGCSCDYARQRFTMDPICARAVREAFFRLFKDELIYRGKRLVNWDPVLQTAVADDECYEEEVDSSFYYLRYPLVLGTPTPRVGSERHAPGTPTPRVGSERHAPGTPTLGVGSERHAPGTPTLGVGSERHAPGTPTLGVGSERHAPGTPTLGVGSERHAPGTPTLRVGSERHAERGGTQPVTWNELAARGYPGADEHPGEQPAWITVATTRPETYLGDTAVAVNPKDRRAVALRGLAVELPLVGRVIPIIEDNYVVLPAAQWDDPDEAKSDPKAQYATGFLKVTPAHDQNDYELGVRHKLPMVNIFGPDATISDKHGWSDPKEIEGAHVFLHKSREEARTLVLREFELRGLLEKPRPYRHSVKFSDRSKAVIEPYLSDQWYVRVTDDRLSGAANRALVPDQRTSAPHGLSEKHLRNPAGSPANAGAPGESTIVSTGARTIPAGATIVSAGAKTISAGATIGSTEPTTDSAGASVDSVGARVGSAEPATGSGGPKTLSGGPSERASENAAGDNSAGDGSMRFYPARYAKTYEQWHDNIRDWCISRQLWWGHRIPVWSGSLLGAATDHLDFASFEYREGALRYKGDAEPLQMIGDAALLLNHWHRAGTAFIRRADGVPLPLDTDEPTEEALRTLMSERLFVCVKDNADAIAVLQAAGFEQDPDVLDTWFSSALWPLSTMGWPGGEALESSDWVHPRLDAAAFAGVASFCGDPDLMGFERYADWNVQRCFNESDSGVLGISIPTEPFSVRVRPGRPDLEKQLAMAGFTRRASDMAGLLEAFNPTSVLSTAREIITLWVSRMVMMNRYLLPPLGTATLRVASGSGTEIHERHAERGGTRDGPVPFRDVFIHAVVQDGDGKKMSKTAGNGVDPLDIIESHGADAMRFTLAQMTTNTQDVRMPVKPDPRGGAGKNTSEKFDAGRNFCNKLWNASRFAMAILERSRGQGAASLHGGSEAGGLRPSALIDRWLLSRLAKAVRSCEGSLKNYEFSDYCQTLYQLLWWDYCDWYLEAIKPTVDSSPATRAVLRSALDVILRLLHPVAPFITEAIFEQLKAHPPYPIPADSVLAGITLESGELLCTSSWPVIAETLIDERAEQDFEGLRELINAIRNVRSEHQILPKRRVTLHCSEPAAKRIASLAPGLVENLAGLEAITSGKPAAGGGGTGGHVTFRAGGEDMYLSNIADAVDAGTEKDLLAKKLEQSKKEAGIIAGRLANPGYADKAPPKLVEESKAKLAKLQAEIAAIEDKLKPL